MTKDNSAGLTPVGAAVLSLGATACVVGTVAGAIVEPEDVATAIQQTSEQVQATVQDYLGTNDCKR